MKLGIQFHVTAYTIDPVTLAVAIEETGFESFWAPDHSVIPVNPATPYPMTGGDIPPVYGQMADPFVLLSFMAAATSRIKLGTGVCIVPERHPVMLAKSVSTLDRFSKGRFLFGVGTGWLPEVTEIFNPHHEKPWTYTEEAVLAMKGLWRDGAAGYEGQMVKFPEVVCDPMPSQRPHPPVIIGAQPTPISCRRIAAWGDGWIAMGVSPKQLAAGRDAITTECERIGRDPAEIEISVGVRDPTPAVQRAFEDAGASRLIVSLYNHTGEALPTGQWADAAAASVVAGPPSPAATLRALEAVHTMAGV